MMSKLMARRRKSTMIVDKRMLKDRLWEAFAGIMDSLDAGSRESVERRGKREYCVWTPILFSGSWGEGYSSNFSE